MRQKIVFMYRHSGTWGTRMQSRSSKQQRPGQHRTGRWTPMSLQQAPCKTKAGFQAKQRKTGRHGIVGCTGGTTTSTCNCEEKLKILGKKIFFGNILHCSKLFTYQRIDIPSLRKNENLKKISILLPGATYVYIYIIISATL